MMIGLETVSYTHLDVYKRQNEAIERIRAIRPPGIRPPRLKMRLESPERGARVVLRAKAATIGYPGRPLFTVNQLKLERGGRAALLGPNGSGKRCV